MKVTSITYERLTSLPGYANHKAGVTIELEEGDEPAKVMRIARAFVFRELAAVHGLYPGPEDNVATATAQIDIPF